MPLSQEAFMAVLKMDEDQPIKEKRAPILTLDILLRLVLSLILQCFDFNMPIIWKT
jgi:hypothetical protein